MAKFGEPGAPSRGPGGRKRLTVAEKMIAQSIEQIAREHTPLAMQTLVEVCRSKKAAAAARVTAAQAILDRGWGKAPQNVNIEGTLDLERASDADIDAAIKRGIAQWLASGPAGEAETENSGLVN